LEILSNFSSIDSTCVIASLAFEKTSDAPDKNHSEQFRSHNFHVVILLSKIATECLDFVSLWMLIVDSPTPTELALPFLHHNKQHNNSAG